MAFRPMLAAEADFNQIKFPLLASPKLDGVRAVTIKGMVFSRSGKLIPNRHVQDMLSQHEYLDGELIDGDPTDPAAFRRTMSTVMTADADASNVKLWAFDHLSNLSLPFYNRWARIQSSAHVVDLHHKFVRTHAELELYEQKILSEGYEGLILRDPIAVYKNGRSTAREGGMLKLKRFVDAEAVVIGFEERMRNANELSTDELGYAKRSSHKENLVGRGDLGALLVRSPDGIEFSIGTGFDDAARALIWEGRSYYLGRTVKYKYFPTGSKDKPRFPVFLGFRAPEDLS